MLLHIGDVDGRSRGSGCLALLFRAQLLEHFFADLQARLGWPGYLLELNDIGQVGEQLGRLEGSFGIDERLPGMRGAHRIGKDALARVKGVGCGLGRGFQVGFRGGFGLFAGDFQERKVVDRAGPGELHVLKQRIPVRRAGEE